MSDTKRLQEHATVLAEMLASDYPEGAEDETPSFTLERAALAAAIAALSEKEQGGQVPVAWIDPRHLTLIRDGSGFFSNVLRTPNNPGTGTVPLYTAPAAGAVPEDVLRDAERWRLVAGNGGAGMRVVWWEPNGSEDEQIQFIGESFVGELADDAMLAAAKGAK